MLVGWKGSGKGEGREITVEKISETEEEHCERFEGLVRWAWWFGGFLCEVERCQTCDAIEVRGYVSEATVGFVEPWVDVKVLTYFSFVGDCVVFDVSLMI
jgi:hypothetical protein